MARLPANSGSVAADLSNCETEPLRFPGAVQPHGAVVVVEGPSARIQAASDSCGVLLGIAAERLVGRALHDVMHEAMHEAMHDAKDRAANGTKDRAADDAKDRAPATSVAAAAAVALLTDAHGALMPLVPLRFRSRDLRARSSVNQEGQVVIDVEPAGEDFLPVLGMAYQRRRVLAQMRGLTDVSVIAAQAAQLVRSLTGFDRVMIYRFDADWNGEVVGEACTAGVDPYLGMHFPASDIPQQARELFVRSHVRHIPDVGYAPSTLLSHTGRPIDLGTSVLRSVSTTHLEYLRNMQVQATLVGSLLVEGRLWGLVSCQHKSGPRQVAPSVRDAVEWLCEDSAVVLESAIIRERAARERSLRERRRRLIDALRETDLKELIRGKGGADLLDVVNADGFALVANDSIQTVGATPSPERIRQLHRWRRDTGSGSTCFASNALARDFGTLDVDGAAGGLFVSLTSGPDVSMIWFRNERRFSQRWGGDPLHMRISDETGRWSPRKSFAQFEQESRGQSLPWTPEELASAADLASLIDIDALKESEALAKSILSSSPHQRVVLDLHGLIMTCNPAWEGLTADSAQSDWVANSVGMHYRSVVAAAIGRPGEADAARAWTGIAAVLDKRTASFVLEYPCVLAQAVRWIRLSVYPLIAPGEGAVVVHEDITGRKLTELRLDYERTQLRTLLETIPDYVWLKDPAGVYLDCNLAFQRLLGATQSAIIGKTDWDFLAAARADSIHQYHLKAVASEGSLVNEQIVNREAPGGPNLLEVTRTPMRDRHGMLLGVLAVGRDITARRRQEDELEQHRHHLERLVDERTAALALAHAAAEAEHRANAKRQRDESEAKMRSSKLEATGTLAAGIAHDFNNILAAIVGFAEMTADELPPGSSAARNVAQILSAGFRARDLVARMLTFARASPVEATRVDIAAEVGEALVLLRASVSAAIEVTFDNELAGDRWVLGAPGQIMQIVMNLCINGSHAIQNRGTINVRLASARAFDDAPPNLRQGICLTVSDTGSGMTAEVRERLFDPFFTTKAPGEGSGLGLSVVYGIVSDMGGTINVDSNTTLGASGSQFRLFLPVPLPAPVPGAIADPVSVPA